MAVVTTKSQVLQDVEASPQVRQDVLHQHGRERIRSASLAVAAGDDDGSQYRFFRVWSGWSIKSIKCYCTAITGGTDYDCGLYTINDGAAVDADLYTDGFSVATAAPAVPPTADGGDGIELRFGDATTAVPGDVNQAVWEDLGLSEDPMLWYDVALTGNTVGTAAGTIALVMRYTAGD